MISKLPLEYHASLLLVVRGRIDGTPAAMMLDTGASQTMLTRFATDKRKLRRDPRGHWATGIGGTTRVFSVPVKHFQIAFVSAAAAKRAGVTPGSPGVQAVGQATGIGKS